MSIPKLIRNWILYLLALSGIAAFAVNYTDWFSAFLFRLTLCLPLFSLLLALPPLFSVTLTFDAPHIVFRDDDCALFLSPRSKTRIPCPYYLPLTVTVKQVYLCDTRQHTVSEPAPDVPGGVRGIPGRLRRLLGRCRRGDDIIRWLIVPYPARRDGRWRVGGSFRIPLDTGHTTVIRTELLTVYQSDPLGLFRFPVRCGTRTTAQAKKRQRGTRSPLLVSEITVLPRTARPRGRMRMWSTAAAALVPTGRPSEQYEIRDYRPGDPLRSVHWKLSAKVDELLVLEPVEPAYRTLAITVDRPCDPDAADAVYDALDWVLRTLAKKEHAGTVICAWVDGEGRTCTETVKNELEVAALYGHMLSDPIPAVLPPHAFAMVYRMYDRGYHLDAASCVGSA